MRKSIVAAALIALVAGTAYAHGPIGATVENVGYVFGHVTHPHPVTGTWSEMHVKAKMEVSALSDVKVLSKDSHGAWHAKVEKHGTPVMASLDTHGNVKTY